MARAIWKGSIAFGLVNIPVELHTAVHHSRPSFRMLHARDHSPISFERVSASRSRGRISSKASSTRKDISSR